MSDVCPFSGKPCPAPHSLIFVADGQQVSLCAACELHPAKMPVVPLMPYPASKIDKLLKALKPAELDSIRCDNCGLTLVELHHTGRLGCEKCYEYFKNVLVQILPQMHHGGEQHVGKKPKCGKDRPVDHLQVALDAMICQQDVYVQEERYEKAAVTRDIIKSIKSLKDSSEHVSADQAPVQSGSAPA